MKRYESPLRAGLLAACGICFLAQAGLAQVAPVPTRPAPATPRPAPATPPAAPRPAPPAPGSDGLIELNFPEAVELRVLIEYVSKRLGMNIVYDEVLGRTRVAISSPTRVDRDALLGLLQSVLNMSNLELVDTADPAFKTIGRKIVTRMVPVRNVGVEELARHANQVMAERERISAAAAGAGRPGVRVIRPPTPAGQIAGSGDVSIIPDVRTNQVAIVGTESAVADAVRLVEMLDVSHNVQTRLYRFKYISPQRMDAMLKGRTQAATPPMMYSATIDEGSGTMLVTGSAAVHEQVQQLVKELDVEPDPNRGYVRFFKLVNSTAAEVLMTIRSLSGEDTGMLNTGAYRRAAHFGSGFSGVGEFGPGYRGGPFSQAGLNPSGSTAFGSSSFGSPFSRLGGGLGGNSGVGGFGRSGAFGSGAFGSGSFGTGGFGGATTRPSSGAPSALTAITQEATITADQNTNTIIVIAAPEVQRVYEQLIEMLDRRRPQVLVEVTIVTLNTSNNFSLGVEMATDFGHRELLVFSNFGLSTVNAATGQITGIPSQGANILLNDDHFQAVIQALARNTRARVVAAPKVLVNDNATATLASIAEQPFTSVNASDTVATTSFAGYASAGTTITLTPHISEGNYLQMKYAVTLNSFTGASRVTNDGGTIPPPRQTDTVDSEVTVPDGSAIIVGGLKRKDLSTTITKVPLLGDIPILKYAFSLTSDTEQENTLFVFIRPTILRDEEFKDLRYLSDRDLEHADLPANLPESYPLTVR